jgi:hypothetical protein
VKKIISGLLISFLLSCLFVTTMLAQAPEKKREFVYGVNVFTGQAYEGTFYPLTEPTLYLLADVTNIISPRHTLVYFWPVTNEYKADWDGLSETVEGTLEILKGNQLVHSLSQVKYIIQYPQGLNSGEVYVYTGPEAEAQYQEFDRQRQAYRDVVAEYYEASRNYRQLLSDRVAKGEAIDQIPPLPEEPEPFLFFSTGVYDGFALELAPGNYTIRLRGEDGQIVPDSTRDLIVFSHQREGVGYTVVPQDKWTTPEQSDDPSQVLYARSGAVIYLQPFVEKEYNELYFTRLSQPQSTTGNRDRWIWLPLQPKEAQHLEILRGGQVVEQIAEKPYLVKQTSGSALGYEVLEQSQAEDERSRTRTPDFEGYEVRVEPGQSSFSLRLVDAEGNIISGSEREVRLVRTHYSAALYLVPVLPLLVGGALAIWRRTKLASLPKYGEAGGRQKE